MLAGAYIISFTGMILLPIIAWIVFTRKFKLSWKLVLAGGLTFIASQIPHIPLVFKLDPFMQKNSLIVNAVILGLLAGIFEETARYILYKFIIKNSRTWKDGILVGLGHGGTEALIIGVAAMAAFVTMTGYRSVDMSTVPGISADQVELATQQVAAYWSAPTYIALMGFVERIFAMCLHVSLSVMVLYAITSKKTVWFWLALLWHALVDAVAVYAIPNLGILATEGLVAIFALISIWFAINLRSKFNDNVPDTLQPETLPA